jgi:hypothetical protein
VVGTGQIKMNFVEQLQELNGKQKLFDEFQVRTFFFSSHNLFHSLLHLVTINPISKTEIVFHTDTGIYLRNPAAESWMGLVDQR